MQYGENIVYYTPVEAYPVMTMDVGIISGGTGGSETTTQGVRFSWAFDPSTPDTNPSGFSGGGWYAETYGSPIWYSTYKYGLTLKQILSQFKEGNRDDLDDVFMYWQEFVNEQASTEIDVVKAFQLTVPSRCWSNINNS